jgi:peptidoglycan/xylan/chitin deacetylase (PgdA/CDA1 family)
LAFGLMLLVVALVAAGFAVFTSRGPRSEVRPLVALGEPIYCGGGKGPYVALTFDDGPTPFTPELLRVLRQNGARATFFEIGEKVAKHPDLARMEAAAGAVGNHTWSHPDLPGLSAAAIDKEVGRANDVIASESGRTVSFFRPPFGARNAEVDRVARRLGLLEVLWNVDSGDASVASTPPSTIIDRNLLDRVRAGAIVLLHEDVTVPRALNAVRMFLPKLRRRGLKAVTLNELLRRDPPVRSELPNGAGGCNSSWHR